MDEAVTKQQALEALEVAASWVPRDHRRRSVETLRAFIESPPSAPRAEAVEAKDAQRYRWLRDVGDATWRPFGIREGYSAAQADAAIDAAIAQGADEGERNHG